MKKPKIYTLNFTQIYELYLAKAKRKTRKPTHYPPRHLPIESAIPTKQQEPWLHKGGR